MNDLVPMPSDDIETVVGRLFEQVSSLIEETRRSVSRQVNTALALKNWHTGKLISTAILHDDRADYGKRVVASLAQQLTARFGRGYEVSNLRRMVQFAREFPDEQIVVSLIRELSWTHILALLPLQSDEARTFYARQATEQRLSVQELRNSISRKAFERREIANAQAPVGSAVPLDTFKDPYILDFLGLKGAYQEHDLEEAILRELQQFILEVGKGFAFVGRQVRMPMNDKDYYLDLLFYSRPMRRLVAVELKIGEFIPEYEGQMRFYLKWLDKYDRGPGEDAPIGLILCTAADRDQVELMELHKDNIVVAEYWTKLLPKEQLEERLKEILRDAKERIARRSLPTTPEATDT